MAAPLYGSGRAGALLLAAVLNVAYPLSADCYLRSKIRPKHRDM